MDDSVSVRSAVTGDRMGTILRSLVEAIEEREAAEPDLPYWQAASRVSRLERQLCERVRDLEPSRSSLATRDPEMARESWVEVA